MTVGVRRSRALTLRYEPRPCLDLAAMLRGNITVTPDERLVAISLLTGQSYSLSDEELRILSGTPSTHWVRVDEALSALAVPATALEPLLDAGLLLSDPAEGSRAVLRAREEAYCAIDWDDYAAQYHVMSRMKDQDVGRHIDDQVHPAEDALASSAERIQQYMGLATAMSQAVAATSHVHGAAPSHFYSLPGAIETRELPPVRAEGRLFELLRSRKTIRLFDAEAPMSADELSTILYYTFGAQGWTPLVPGLIGLRKTSPSGGSLHPIEVYPLVLNVREIATGLYHYNVERHGLELFKRLDRTQAETLAESVTLGQSYFRSAHVLFILTARWYRNFWKYRKAQKSYRVIHVDAGHLSQTLYLLCQELGLGAFYTGAINDVNIEELLEVDPLQEGVIGVSGCGRPLNGGKPLTLETMDYSPFS
jgi:putative peptide maturation dehydrogenase